MLLSRAQLFPDRQAGTQSRHKQYDRIVGGQSTQQGEIEFPCKDENLTAKVTKF